MTLELSSNHSGQNTFPRFGQITCRIAMGWELTDYYARPFWGKGPDVCCSSAILNVNGPEGPVPQGVSVNVRNTGILAKPGCQVRFDLGFWP